MLLLYGSRMLTFQSIRCSLLCTVDVILSVAPRIHTARLPRSCCSCCGCLHVETMGPVCPDHGKSCAPLAPASRGVVGPRSAGHWQDFGRCYAQIPLAPARNGADASGSPDRVVSPTMQT